MNTLLKILAVPTMILVMTAASLFIVKELHPQTPAPVAAIVPAPALPAPVPVVKAAPVPAPAAVAPPAPAPAAAAPAPTPGPSSIMTTSAWKSMEAKNYDEAITNAQKCIDLFKQDALDQQKALTAPATDKDEVFKSWALNDVGTCYFIVGTANEKLNKNKEAVDAYQYLVDNLPFAQCYDPKGWFWKPAAGAKDRIKALQLDTLK
jgi:hypothetical protein